MIIDTHFGIRSLPDYHYQRDKRISKLVWEAVFRGRFYNESGLEKRPTASRGNTVSVWPTVTSLEREMYEAGYEVVEQYNPPYLDRGFFTSRSLGNHVGKRLERLVTRFNPVRFPRRVGHAPSMRRACLRRRSGMPPNLAVNTAPEGVRCVAS